MPKSYYPTKDSEFTIWLQNFTTVANANLVALDIVAGDLAPITTLQPTYTNNLNDVEAKKAALAGAVETKDATKATIIQNVRVVVNKIQANPDVTTALKAQLGISTREGGQYPLNPVEPNELVAEINVDGTIELSWNRNNNGPTTQFVIFAKIGNEANYRMLDVVTKTNYKHIGVTLAERIEYYVKARKNGVESGPSNIAIINPGSVGV